MYGRFIQAYTWQELVALYRLTVPAINLQPRYNIAPTTTIEVIILRGVDRLELAPMRWGLIPSQWKKTAKEVRFDLQRPRRNRGREADVPRCLQERPLRDPGLGLLLPGAGLSTSAPAAPMSHGSNCSNTTGCNADLATHNRFYH